MRLLYRGHSTHPRARDRPRHTQSGYVRGSLEARPLEAHSTAYTRDSSSRHRPRWDAAKHTITLVPSTTDVPFKWPTRQEAKNTSQDPPIVPTGMDAATTSNRDSLRPITPPINHIKDVTMVKAYHHKSHMASRHRSTHLVM